MNPVVKDARRNGSILSAALLAMLLVNDSAAASPAVCNIRLSVELTPDVPNPLDSGFLSSLLSNQASYQLTLLRQRSGSVIVLELAGPGPEYRCQNVVEAMRQDGRVLSIHLDKELSDETVAVTIAGAPLLPEQKADTHPSPGGIASLYWAARHPRQAWRVFLPIQLDGAIAAERATAETLTEGREISAHPSARMLASHTGGKCVRRTQSGEAT